MTITQIVIAKLFMIIKIQVAILPSNFRGSFDVFMVIVIIHFLLVCCLDVRKHPGVTSQTL